MSIVEKENSFFLFYSEDSMRNITKTVIADLEKEIDNKLSTDHDILFSFPILFYSLRTEIAQSGMNILKKWYLCPPKSLNISEYHILIQIFCKYFHVSIEKLSYDIISSFSILMKSLFVESKNEYDIKTYECVSSTLINILKHIKVNISLNQYNLDSQILFLISTIIINGDMNEELQMSLIIDYSMNCDPQTDWTKLIDSVLKSMFQTKGSTRSLSLLFMIKQVMKSSPIFNEDIVALSFGTALSRINTIINENTLFTGPYPTERLLSFLGDWAFSLVKADSNLLFSHINDVFQVFTFSRIPQESKWFCVFIDYINYLLSINHPTIVLSVICSSHSLACWRPDLFLPIYESVLNSALWIHHSLNPLFPLYLSGEWVDLFSDLFSLFTISKNDNGLTDVKDAISIFCSLPTNTIGNKDIILHRSFLLIMCNDLNGYFNQILTFRTYAKRNMNTKNWGSNAFRKLYLSLIMSIWLLPLFIPISSSFIIVIQKFLVDWINEIRNIPEEPSYYCSLLMALFIFSHYYEFPEDLLPQYGSIEKCSYDLPQLVKSFPLFVKNSIIIPKLSTNHNVFCDQKHFGFNNDRIISTSQEKDQVFVTVRSINGITLFHGIKYFSNETSIESSNTKILKKSEIDITGISPFDSFSPLINHEDHCLEIEALYNLGVYGNCTPVNNPDFSKFEKLCDPITININIGSMSILSNSFLEEPIMSHNFGVFLADIGDSLKIDPFMFKLKPGVIKNEEICIMFVDSPRPLKNIQSTRIPSKAMIAVYPVFESSNYSNRAYRICVQRTNEKNFVSPISSNSFRIYSLEQMKIVITSLLLFCYGQMEFSKSENSIKCDLIEYINVIYDKREKEIIDIIKMK